jgi:phosphatidylserine/phosphatidylglycerophosphate/cardiolipin synthase-like enzyme
VGTEAVDETLPSWPNSCSSALSDPKGDGAGPSLPVTRTIRLLSALDALSACSSLPQVEQSELHVILNSAHIRLDKAIAPTLNAHRGMSGAYPLVEGTDALAARVGLVWAAEQTLDAQYDLFHSDHTGLALLGELLSAADRGVRARHRYTFFHSFIESSTAQAHDDRIVPRTVNIAIDTVASSPGQR